MKPVMRFHDWDRELDLQLHSDHIRLGDADLPYEVISSVAIQRTERDTIVDLARLVIRLGDDELDLALPVEDAERAKLLIQVPEARDEALLGPAFDLDEGPVLDPGPLQLDLGPLQLDPGPLFDSAPLEESALEVGPIWEGPLVGAGPSGATDPLFLEPEPLMALLPPASPEPSLEADEESRRAIRRRLRDRDRGAAGMVFSGVLLLIAVGAVIFLAMPHPASRLAVSHRVATHEHEAAHAASRAAIPPTTREARPRTAPSPAVHHRRHGKKVRGGVNRPRRHATSPSPPLVPAPVSTAIPAPVPQPPVTTAPPPPIPKPSVTTAPVPSPTISIG